MSDIRGTDEPSVDEERRAATLDALRRIDATLVRTQRCLDDFALRLSGATPSRVGDGGNEPAVVVRAPDAR